MSRGKGRASRDRRLVDKTLVPPVQRDPLLHSPQECSDCVEPHDDPIYLSETDRVVTRMQLHNGRLVDFALMQQRLADGAWLDVVTIDCRHDEAHIHWHDADGKKSGKTDIMPIRTQQDVEVACDEAAEMLYGQWEDNLRRCIVGR